MVDHTEPQALLIESMLTISVSPELPEDFSSAGLPALKAQSAAKMRKQIDKNFIISSAVIKR